MFSVLKKIFKQLFNILSNFIYLKKKNFKTVFLYEGSIEISLPRLSILDFFKKDNYLQINQSAEYLSRPHLEPLLRKTIYELFKKKIESNKSVIDIGCLFGDNANSIYIFEIS